MRTTMRAGILALALLGAGGPAAGQSLAERVARAPEGAVRFTYPARPGVCGEGNDIIVRREAEEGKVRVISGSYRRGSEWGERCVEGRVRVELAARGGAVRELRIRVGTDFPGAARELGEATGAEAADFLLDLAARAPEEVGRDALVAATLARGVQIHPRLLALAASDEVPMETRRQAVFWAGQDGAPLADLKRVYAGAPEPVRHHLLFVFSQRDDPEAARELLRVARSQDEPRKLRKQAVFWLGEAAGRAATRDLGDMVDDEAVDVEVREQAIFALSRREEGVPALLRIARESPDPRLRRKAIFWLGQSEDPRALSLFRELLGIR
jgi:hypothetical protein